jgi:hypothetical protein
MMGEACGTREIEEKGYGIRVERPVERDGLEGLCVDGKITAGNGKCAQSKSYGAFL